MPRVYQRTVRKGRGGTSLYQLLRQRAALQSEGDRLDCDGIEAVLRGKKGFISVLEW